MTEVLVKPDMAVPEAYVAFTPVLERLSQPMLQVLCGQLEQFERLDLHLYPQQPAPRGEFEGLGGLAQRGDLSHIVQSELLLRSEAPLEFLRRLAESETLFLEKEYADPGVRPIYRAMISVGPGVLGHGRMIALAALLFMARQAATRGGDFHWCFLPRGEGAVWFDEVSVNTVKRFLRAASYREMSLEDMDEATALWSRFMSDAGTGTGPVDWVIGARPWRVALQDARPHLAIEGAANTLAFSLAPPVAATPRSVELRLRRGRRDWTRAAIILPDDHVCTGALKSPFRPPTPTPGAAPPPARRREPRGWAPQYFTVAADKIIVRVADGLLILTVDRKGAVLNHWFAPLAADTQFAGFRLHQTALSVLLQSERSGADQLYYGRFALGWGKTPPALEASHVTRATAVQLFRNQPAYSLPTITTSGAVRFHSTSGNPFELTPSPTDKTMTFAPLHNAAKILHSTGVHEVIAIQWRNERLFRVVRAGRERLTDFRGLTEAEADVPVLGLLYSHPDRTLAYSRTPNEWIVADPAHGAATAELETFTLKPCETLLSGNRQGAAVILRIWSDAGLGGAGEVQSLRIGDRAHPHRTPLVNLEGDALSIARMAYSDDGALWGVTIDETGAPAELLNYRRRKGDARSALYRFDLAELSRSATVIDLGLIDV